MHGARAGLKRPAAEAAMPRFGRQRVRRLPRSAVLRFAMSLPRRLSLHRRPGPQRRASARLRRNPGEYVFRSGI